MSVSRRALVSFSVTVIVITAPTAELISALQVVLLALKLPSSVGVVAPFKVLVAANVELRSTPLDMVTITVCPCLTLMGTVVFTATPATVTLLSLGNTMESVLVAPQANKKAVLKASRNNWSFFNIMNE